MGRISDIRQVMELIAKTHPGIGHDPDGMPKKVRFYGYNMDESNTGDRDNMSFPRMGMATKVQTGLTGRYETMTASVRDFTYIEIILIDSVPTNDYNGEEGCYDRMKVVMDDIITWISYAVMSSIKFKYPALSYINVSQISYARVASMTGDKACGFKMTIPFIAEMEWTDANPLNSLNA